MVGGPSDATEYADLPTSAKGLFRARPPEDWLTCAQGATVLESKNVPCSNQHDWRAVTTIKLGGPKDPYPGDRLSEVRSKDYCSDSVGAWMNYPIDYEFGYTWFHEAEWQAGRQAGRQPSHDLLGEDRRMSSLPWAALLALVALAGCSSGDPEAAPEPSPSVSVSSAPPAPASPKVGECHALSVTEATDPVDTGGPVPCRRPHTSVTIKVGKLTPVADGHLLAVDSETVRKQIADACPDSPGAIVGGDQTTQRLSRFEVVWFSPSLEEADAGANWYRCDVVALRSEGKLLVLPARLKGVLDQEGALDRFGTCGTAAPDARDFARVVCSQKHSWRAVDIVELPPDARHLAKDVAAQGDAACKDVAAERANGALRYTWSFEWPTRAQWAAGQRYGYCWVPEG